MFGSHPQLLVALAALCCLLVVQSSASVTGIPILVIPRVMAASAAPPTRTIVPLKELQEDDRFFTADITARAYVETMAEHFDSSLIQSRIGIYERQAMLSKLFDVQVTVQPLGQTAFFPSSISQVIIQRAFVLHPPFEPITYFDQDKQLQQLSSPVPFFFSVELSCHDVYEALFIPVDKIDIIKLDSVPPWLEIAIGLKFSARAIREQLMVSHFLPLPNNYLPVHSGETIKYRLSLPTDMPFHPSTFSHRLFNLGDILKMVYMYCANQRVDFESFCSRAMPYVCIKPIESRFKDTKHTHYNNMRNDCDNNACDLFIQILSCPTFYLIKPPTPYACLQKTEALVLKDVPWPPLRMLVSNVPIIVLARFHDFVSEPKEQPVIGQAAWFEKLPWCPSLDKDKIAESMQAAKEAWIDVDIPASTPEPLRMLRAVMVLRRLPVKSAYERRTFA